jgi:hypothetical protein
LCVAHNCAASPQNGNRSRKASYWNFGRIRARESAECLDHDGSKALAAGILGEIAHAKVEGEAGKEDAREPALAQMSGEADPGLAVATARNRKRAARSWLGLALPWWPWHRQVALDVGGRAYGGATGISRIHLIAPTTADFHDVNLEGRSGILATCGRDPHPRWVMIIHDVPEPDRAGHCRCRSIGRRRRGGHRGVGAVERRPSRGAGRPFHQRQPGAVGEAVVRCHDDFDGDDVVVEVNFGGDMATEAMKQASERVHERGDRESSLIRIKEVSASRGKVMRAEPISLLYEKGRVLHRRGLDQLEAEMMAFSREWDRAVDGSPNRLDAAV